MSDSDKTGFYDPYEEFPYTGNVEAAREFIEVGVGYNGVCTRYVAQSLREGDVVDVELMLKGSPTKRLSVKQYKMDVVEVVDLNGKSYHLWPESFDQNNPTAAGETWLREPDHTSAGVVSEITVVTLS